MENEIMKPEWRPVLELRSVEDKIGVVIDCDLADVTALPVVTELVREGIIRWIDRACLQHLVAIWKTGEQRIGINCDIYQLTTKGIKLCNDNGIKQQ